MCDTLEAAASRGHVACMSRLRFDGAPWRTDGADCNAAAFHGEFDCLRYAHEGGAPWHVGGHASLLAASNGHLDCLRYAHRHGAPWGDGTGDGTGACALALANGHLDCLRYALGAGACRLSPLIDACRRTRGDLGVLTRLRAAVRALELAWLGRRADRGRRRVAAVAAIEAAWLDACYRPGGAGASRAIARLRCS